MGVGVRSAAAFIGVGVVPFVAMLLAVLMLTCCFVQAASATTYLTMAAVASSSGLFPYVVSIGKVLNTHCPEYNITVSESGGNVDNTKRVVAKIGTVYYTSLEDAIP